MRKNWIIDQLFKKYDWEIFNVFSLLVFKKKKTMSLVKPGTVHDILYYVPGKTKRMFHR